MTEDLILHNLSPKTSRRYIKWVADFAQHFHTSPEQLGPEHVRSYLLHLIQERQVSWNIHKEARLALQFLYRVTLGREGVVERSPAPRRPRRSRSSSARTRWPGSSTRCRTPSTAPC